MDQLSVYIRKVTPTKSLNGVLTVAWDVSILSKPDVHGGYHTQVAVLGQGKHSEGWGADHPDHRFGRHCLIVLKYVDIVY